MITLKHRLLDSEVKRILHRRILTEDGEVIGVGLYPMFEYSTLEKDESSAAAYVNTEEELNKVNLGQEFYLDLKSYGVLRCVCTAKNIYRRSRFVVYLRVLSTAKLIPVKGMYDLEILPK